jgi:hypothetical protein
MRRRDRRGRGSQPLALDDGLVDGPLHVELHVGGAALVVEVNADGNRLPGRQVDAVAVPKREAGAGPVVQDLTAIHRDPHSIVGVRAEDVCPTRRRYEVSGPATEESISDHPGRRRSVAPVEVDRPIDIRHIGRASREIAVGGVPVLRVEPVARPDWRVVIEAHAEAAAERRDRVGGRTRRQVPGCLVDADWTGGIECLRRVLAVAKIDPERPDGTRVPGALTAERVRRQPVPRLNAPVVGLPVIEYLGGHGPARRVEPAGGCQLTSSVAVRRDQEAVPHVIAVGITGWIARQVRLRRHDRRAVPGRARLAHVREPGVIEIDEAVVRIEVLERRRRAVLAPNH